MIASIFFVFILLIIDILFLIYFSILVSISFFEFIFGFFSGSFICFFFFLLWFVEFGGVKLFWPILHQMLFCEENFGPDVERATFLDWVLLEKNFESLHYLYVINWFSRKLITLLNVQDLTCLSPRHRCFSNGTHLLLHSVKSLRMTTLCSLAFLFCLYS